MSPWRKFGVGRSGADRWHTRHYVDVDVLGAKGNTKSDHLRQKERTTGTQCSMRAK